jgi:hypothetical protein
MAGAVRSVFGAGERPTEGPAAPRGSGNTELTGGVTVPSAGDRPTEGPAAPQGSKANAMTGAVRTIRGAGDRHTKGADIL